MIAILDAGPLVSLFNQDAHHAWAVEVFHRYRGPFYTTELVLCEIAHLTDRDAELADWVKCGKLLSGGTVWEHAEQIARCLTLFPHCDLADASLIVASELHPRLDVLTTDARHFLTYRRADGSALPVVVPPMA
jgi:predicted nucleic acid-binding protein